MSLRTTAKTIASIIAPGWLKRYQRKRLEQYLKSQARLLRHRYSTLGSLEELVEAEGIQNGPFKSYQKRGEILGLLRLLEDQKPKCLCEIGTKRGGTLFLFMQVAAPEARILAVDFDFTTVEIAAFEEFARLGQELHCLAADSHAPETLQKIEDWLGSEKFDFLFIDGDHSLSGVLTDFLNFSPYVREGGLIAVHDICPDYETVYGVKTQRHGGEVHRFWKMLSAIVPDVIEFVEEPGQDGYGIGVIVNSRNHVAKVRNYLQQSLDHDL